MQLFSVTSFFFLHTITRVVSTSLFVFPSRFSQQVSNSNYKKLHFFIVGKAQIKQHPRRVSLSLFFYDIPGDGLRQISPFTRGPTPQKLRLPQHRPLLTPIPLLLPPLTLTSSLVPPMIPTCGIEHLTLMTSSQKRTGLI